MKLLHIIGFLIISSFLMAGTEEKKTSRFQDLGIALFNESEREIPKEVKELLAKYKFEGNRIPQEHFERTKIEELNKRIPEDYIIYKYSSNPTIADEFTYSVIKERKSDRFWVIRQGGYAGVFEIHKPKTEPVETDND